jgi:[CysO sulfur-carrier protein]-S-L-cysteine hydrolase
VLSEPQIQRYARQLLLNDVGERGQEALGALRVELALAGDVASGAAAYLRAGGTEVDAPGETPGPWARTPPLLEAMPSARLQISAAPAIPVPAGLVLGSRAGSHVVLSAGEDGCAACLRDVVQGLRPPEAHGESSVQVGTLVALLVQRRALGLAPDLEGLEVSDTGTLTALAPPTCTHRPVVPADVLTALVRHLAAALPDEGCAVLVGRGDRLRLVPMENAQAAHHARDPDTFPGSPRTAFSLDPRAWLALLRQTDAAGERVVAISHSHPGGVAHFSAEDRRWAAPDGQPLLPGVAHLVIAFRQGIPVGACWAVWSGGDFVELACPLPLPI